MGEPYSSQKQKTTIRSPIVKTLQLELAVEIMELLPSVREDALIIKRKGQIACRKRL